ncbi:MAG: diphthine--ammonia ligase [Candidatus Micrarchaeota archaeon]|nr:diphthine--ammonia ligase [Candidatus Micrarchaeota archaeon]
MTNACLFSGGKDSTLALHKAMELGAKIDLLITMRSANRESYMFHYPNIELTRLQAEALGMRHVFEETEGRKEEELQDLRNAFEKNDVKLLVTGATFSKYQADRINGICKEMGIEHVAPLWHIDPLEELEEIANRYNAILTSVSAEGLSTSLLGKRIDKEMIERLKEANRKHGVNLVFEGGEAETFVLDAPLFKRRIEVEKARVERNGENGMFVIESARLAAK